MKVLAAVLAVGLLLFILLDAFETVVLPRRVTRRFRLAAGFYRFTWRPVAALAKNIRSLKKRESILAVYGPSFMLLLMVLWALGLVFGFAILQWAAGGHIHVNDGPIGFRTLIYYSGTSFFTLGLGDIYPTSDLARVLTVTEAGMGFAFLALILGYLPVLYGAFSEREANITLLDARAGSPPTAAELLRRHAATGHLGQLFAQWELWAARVLESHVSYPVLMFYRSQHDNQSWLAAMTTLLDATSFAIVALGNDSLHQAELTFAITRHAVVDLAAVMRMRPKPPAKDRLSSQDLAVLQAGLAKSLPVRTGSDVEEQLKQYRKLYEPYVNALAEGLLFPLPHWVPVAKGVDNWQTGPWGRVARPSLTKLPDDEEAVS